MKLSNIRIEDYVDNYGEERSRLICNVSECAICNVPTVWIGVQRKYKEWLCADVYDAFMIGFLYPAMYFKEDIVIDGAVTRELYINTVNKFLHMCCAFDPTISPCSIKAKSLIAPPPSFFADGARNKHVGVGFGGGVDSFFTLHKNFFEPQDDQNIVDTLMFLHTDNYGDPRRKESWDRARNYYKSVEALGRDLKINSLMTTSNLYEFNPPYPAGLPTRDWTRRIDGFRLRIAAVLALQGGLRRYYFSTSATYKENLVNHGKMWEAGVLWLDEWCESFALPALSTSNIELVSDGGVATRTQKIEQIIDNPYVKKYLTTCTGGDPNGHNCGTCEKCKRMMLTLDIMGRIDDFKQTYDSEHFLKHIYLYKCAVVLNQKKTGDLMADDILALAQKYNYEMPSYWEAKFYTMTREVWHKLLAVKKIFRMK